jgi:hypothetical protein
MSQLSVTQIITGSATTDQSIATGNTAAGKIAILSAGGMTLYSNSTVNAISISVTGNVGISNSAPTDKLSVAGTMSTGNTTITGFINVSSNAIFTGGIIANGSIGTAGQVLTSNAAGLYWTTPASYTISTGLVNTTGTLTVNSAYIATISSNNSSFLGGTAAASYALLSGAAFTGNTSVTGTASMYSYTEQTNTAVISAATLTINAAAATTFDVNLNAAITTFSFQNLAAAGKVSTFTIVFTADGTARAITWPTAVKWPSNTAPTLTSTLNKKDIFTFFTEDAGTTILAFASGQNCG